MPPVTIMRGMGITVYCATCAKCGVWVVIRKGTAIRLHDKGKSESMTTVSRVTCPKAKCGHQFKVEDRQTHPFEVGQYLFERGYFYPSDVRHEQASQNER